MKSYNHKSVRSLYKRLVSDLSSIDIYSCYDYLRYRSVRDYFVDQKILSSIEKEFTRNLIEIYPTLTEQIKDNEGLTFIVEDTSPFLTDEHRKK